MCKRIPYPQSDIVTYMEEKFLVIGGGFVGLTLSAKLLKTNSTKLTVIENDVTKLEILKRGQFYVTEPGLHSILLTAISENRLNFTGAISNEQFKAVFISVGTPLSIVSEDSPNNIFGLVDLVSKCLEKNGMIFLRSTVAVGTTEKFAISIRKNGRFDINTYFLPERTAEGVALLELDTLPQVIGATSNSKLELAVEFLQDLGFTIIECSNSKSAEFVKLISNAWRDTIFGVSNEIALMAEYIGVDAGEIIKVSNFNYPRANIPTAGPVGGPCLSKDSHILLSSFDKEFQKQSIISNARTINEKVESNIYKLLLRHLESSDKIPLVLFIGAAFKGSPKTNDTRNGLTSNLINRIRMNNKQVAIKIWDPTLDRDDLLDLADFMVATISEISPNLVVIGNNSKEVVSKNVVEFLDGLSSKSLVIDPWRIYSKSEKSLVKVYQLGLGMVDYDKS